MDTKEQTDEDPAHCEDYSARTVFNTANSRVLGARSVREQLRKASALVLTHG